MHHEYALGLWKPSHRVIERIHQASNARFTTHRTQRCVSVPVTSRLLFSHDPAIAWRHRDISVRAPVGLIRRTPAPSTVESKRHFGQNSSDAEPHCNRPATSAVQHLTAPSRVDSNARWANRYRTLATVRSRGDFRLHSVRDATTGLERTLVVAADGVEAQLAHSALSRLRDAHNATDHPLIPKVLEVADEPAIALLDFPGVADGNTMLQRVSERQLKLSYGAADAFIAQLRDALRSAHTRRSPLGDRPLCLGRIAYGNLLFARDGSFCVIGFGHNVITDDASGHFSGEPACFQAPEVAVKSELMTPQGDYLALLLLMRSLMPMVDFPASFEKVVLGQLPGPESEVIRSSLEWFNTNVYGAPPDQRASIDEAVAVSTRIREALDLKLEPDEFRATVTRLLEAEPAPASVGETTLELGPGARWIRIDAGDEVTVSRRGPMRGILLELLAQRERDDGVGADCDQLFAAGWPGETLGEASRRNRVYVAISTLRRMGLREGIIHDGDGYRFAPQWRITSHR